MGLETGAATAPAGTGACRPDARVRHSTCANATELAAASGSQVVAGRLWTITKRGCWTVPPIVVGFARSGEVHPGGSLRQLGAEVGMGDPDKARARSRAVRPRSWATPYSVTT